MTTETPTASVGIVRTLGRIGDLFVSIAAAQQAAAAFDRRDRGANARVAATALGGAGQAPAALKREFD